MVYLPKEAEQEIPELRQRLGTLETCDSCLYWYTRGYAHGRKVGYSLGWAKGLACSTAAGVGGALVIVPASYLIAWLLT
jgi:hypothetical protein